MADETQRRTQPIPSPDHPALPAVETPALVLDVTALRRNIAAMALRASKAGMSLRPHAKTHKSVEIARLQIKAGATGIACATVAEVEAMAGAGITGLLLTAPQIGAGKFGWIAALNRAQPLSIVVDHASQIEGLARSMQAGDPPLNVLVDVDVGQARTGVTTPTEAVRLVQLIAGQPTLAFAGLQGFAGNAQHIADPAERRAAAAAAAQLLRDCGEALAQAGLTPHIITGSGTGTYAQDSEGPYTELQVGSYVFMDSDYARIVDEKGAGPAFEPSLFVLATVVSVNRPGQVTVDAGTKALATNGPPPCRIIGAPERTTYRFAGDEHGILAIPDGQRPPSLGARVLIGATHCDPTVNLHACYRVIDGPAVQTWPVAARYGA